MRPPQPLPALYLHTPSTTRNHPCCRLLARGSWQQWERVHRLTTLPGEPPFIAELVADGVGAVLRAEAAGQLQPKYPFMYASAADLSLVRIGGAWIRGVSGEFGLQHAVRGALLVLSRACVPSPPF